MVMVATTESPARARVKIITAISQAFADWCQEKGYPLPMERIGEWQREYRRERGISAANYYAAFTADQLEQKARKAAAILERIKTAQAALR